MPCYHPIRAYKPAQFNTDKFTGEKYMKPVSFQRPKGDYREIKVACGQCIGCRLEYARKWAVRIMHETVTFPDSHFLTLTMNDEFLKFRGHNSLDKKDLQKFFKRLRHHAKGVLPVEEKGQLKWPIRYYACGEYGELTGRPHYHACVFNLQIPDKQIYKKSSDYWLYNSEWLDNIWTCPDSGLPMGHCVIGDVTFQSASYCARYMLKKQKGLKGEDIYHPDTGEIVIPEFVTMSRRPGLGKYWFDKYKNDIYPNDFVIVNGKQSNVPRTYDEYLKNLNEAEYEEIKGQREINALKFIDNNTPERLLVREKCAIARQSKLKRLTE